MVMSSAEIECTECHCWSLPYDIRKTTSRYTNLYKRKQTKIKQMPSQKKNRKKKRIKTREIEIEAPRQGEEIKQIPSTPLTHESADWEWKRKQQYSRRSSDRKKKLKQGSIISETKFSQIKSNVLLINST